MGVNMFCSSCDCNDYLGIKNNREQVMKRSDGVGQPNPNNFVIEDMHTVQKGSQLWVIVALHYPDCTNYEGRKILVFYGVTTKTIMNAKVLDPHFCDNPRHTGPIPIARFEPTDRGKHMAIEFCNMMADKYGR